LNHTLVDGVRIVEAGWADDAGPSLMARVSGARYRLEAGGIEQAFRTTFRPGREAGGRLLSCRPNCSLLRACLRMRSS